jgi:hypothetical protein
LLANVCYPASSNNQFPYLISFHFLYSPPGLVIPSQLMVAECSSVCMEPSCLDIHEHIAGCSVAVYASFFRTY